MIACGHGRSSRASLNGFRSVEGSASGPPSTEGQSRDYRYRRADAADGEEDDAFHKKRRIRDTWPVIRVGLPRPNREVGQARPTVMTLRLGFATTRRAIENTSAELGRSAGGIGDFPDELLDDVFKEEHTGSVPLAVEHPRHVGAGPAHGG
jgi:hypothetical protein